MEGEFRMVTEERRLRLDRIRRWFREYWPASVRPNRRGANVKRFIQVYSAFAGSADSTVFLLRLVPGIRSRLFIVALSEIIFVPTFLHSLFGHATSVWIAEIVTGAEAEPRMACSRTSELLAFCFILAFDGEGVLFVLCTSCL